MGMLVQFSNALQISENLLNLNSVSAGPLLSNFALFRNPNNTLYDAFGNTSSYAPPMKEDEDLIYTKYGEAVFFGIFNVSSANYKFDNKPQQYNTYLNICRIKQGDKDVDYYLLNYIINIALHKLVLNLGDLYKEEMLTTITTDLLEIYPELLNELCDKFLACILKISTDANKMPPTLISYHQLLYAALNYKNNLAPIFETLPLNFAQHKLVFPSNENRNLGWEILNDKP